jgi:hypothetical protein
VAAEAAAAAGMMTRTAYMHTCDAAATVADAGGGVGHLFGLGVMGSVYTTGRLPTIDVVVHCRGSIR